MGVPARQADQALLELINLYLRLSPDPAKASASMKIWLVTNLSTTPTASDSQKVPAVRRDVRMDAEKGSTHRPVADPSEWMSPAETAAYIGLHVKTLANWRSLGTGPNFTRIGKIRYRRADVDAWLQARIRQAHPAEQA